MNIRSLWALHDAPRASTMSKRKTSSSRFRFLHSFGARLIVSFLLLLLATDVLSLVTTGPFFWSFSTTQRNAFQIFHKALVAPFGHVVHAQTITAAAGQQNLIEIDFLFTYPAVGTLTQKETEKQTFEAAMKTAVQNAATGCTIHLSCAFAFYPVADPIVSLNSGVSCAALCVVSPSTEIRTLYTTLSSWRAHVAATRLTSATSPYRSYTSASFVSLLSAIQSSFASAWGFDGASLVPSSVDLYTWCADLGAVGTFIDNDSPSSGCARTVTSSNFEAVVHRQLLAEGSTLPELPPLGTEASLHDSATLLFTFRSQITPRESIISYVCGIVKPSSLTCVTDGTVGVVDASNNFVAVEWDFLKGKMKQGGTWGGFQSIVSLSQRVTLRHLDDAAEAALKIVDDIRFSTLSTAKLADISSIILLAREDDQVEVSAENVIQSPQDGAFVLVDSAWFNPTGDGAVVFSAARDNEHLDRVVVCTSSEYMWLLSLSTLIPLLYIVMCGARRRGSQSGRNAAEKEIQQGMHAAPISTAPSLRADEDAAYLSKRHWSEARAKDPSTASPNQDAIEMQLMEGDVEEEEEEEDEEGDDHETVTTDKRNF